MGNPNILEKGPQSTPWLLLGMTFLLGLGSALNAPAWQATTPDLVPREEAPAAVALAGFSMNGARAVGPALGGFTVAAVGPGTTFLLNALSFLGVLFVLARWRRPRETSALPAERLVGMMRGGLRYVRVFHFGVRPSLPVIVREENREPMRPG
jgi:MFS family permease